MTEREGLQSAGTVAGKERPPTERRQAGGRRGRAVPEERWCREGTVGCGRLDRQNGGDIIQT